jgi:hypothetical protein
MDNIMQGLRHQNPHLWKIPDIKAEQELVELKFLSIQVQIISKQIHETSLILGHRRTTLSQGVEVIDLALNEFLRQISLPEPFLEQFP